MADDKSGDTSRRKQVIRIVVALVVVVGAFFGILPKIADMKEVGEAVRGMTGSQLGALLGITTWNQVTYWLIAVAAMPGLKFAQASVMNLSSTAIANTVPGGGALGVGVMTKMFRSWGFAPGEIGRFIVVTGIWNNFVKLGMPPLALGLLAIQGDADSKLVLAAVIGVVLLAVSVVALVAMLRSDAFARRLGGWTESVINGARGLFKKDPVDGWQDRASTFREDSNELLRDRWHWLTLTTLVGHVSLYAVLLVTLRALEVSPDDLTWTEVLAAFSFARLITAIPVTPGGVGVIELGYVGTLVAFGGQEAVVVAATLVFRTFTYLLPVPLGALAYVVWKRKSDWREDDADADDGEDGDGEDGDEVSSESA